MKRPEDIPLGVANKRQMTAHILELREYSDHLESQLLEKSEQLNTRTEPARPEENVESCKTCKYLMNGSDKEPCLSCSAPTHPFSNYVPLS